eukprot:scaffold38562_cov27-Tisochrysis_lutea.AAC.1
MRSYARWASARDCSLIVGWCGSSASTGTAERASASLSSPSAYRRSEMGASRPGSSAAIRRVTSESGSWLASVRAIASSCMRCAACLSAAVFAEAYRRLAQSPALSRISSAETSLISGAPLLPVWSACSLSRSASAEARCRRSMRSLPASSSRSSIAPRPAVRSAVSWRERSLMMGWWATGLAHRAFSLSWPRALAECCLAGRQVCGGPDESCEPHGSSERSTASCSLRGWLEAYPSSWFSSPLAACSSASSGPSRKAESASA